MNYNFDQSKEMKIIENECNNISMINDLLIEAMLYKEEDLPITHYIKALNSIKSHLKNIRDLF